MTEATWPETQQQKRAHRLDDPRSRAIDALNRAGRAAEVDEVIHKMSDRAQATYREFQQDDSRSDEWKHEQMTAAYAGFKTSLTDQLVSLARDAERDDQRDASAVFGTSGLPGDAGSLAISSRDAADRVYSASSDDLRDLLTRATRIGDEVLARSVVKRAIEEGQGKIVEDFTNDRPELRDATQRLWDRARRGETAQLRSAFNTLGIVPMWGLRS